jgi:hypothetical protein
MRSLALIFMAFKALGCIDIFLELDRMLARVHADCGNQQKRKKHRPEESSHPSISPGREFQQTEGAHKGLRLLLSGTVHQATHKFSLINWACLAACVLSAPLLAFIRLSKQPV